MVREWSDVGKAVRVKLAAITPPVDDRIWVADCSTHREKSFVFSKGILQSLLKRRSGTCDP